MSPQGRVLFLLVATVIFFFEGATAASRQLTQVDSLWLKAPKFAALYSQNNLKGRTMRLRVGTNTLSAEWKQIARSMWLPDGYYARVYFGQDISESVFVETYRTTFAPGIKGLFHSGIPSFVGKVTKIVIVKEKTWVDTMISTINTLRQKQPPLVHNPKMSKLAYQKCQNDAKNGDFSSNKYLGVYLSEAGIKHDAFGVVSEKGMYGPQSSIKYIYQNQESARILSEARWKEIGVGYAQAKFLDDTYYVCIYLVSY